MLTFIAINVIGMIVGVILLIWMRNVFREAEEHFDNQMHNARPGLLERIIPQRYIDYDVFEPEFEKAVAGIIGELLKPQNHDLLLSFLKHGYQHRNFEFELVDFGKLDFDKFCWLEHQMDALGPILAEALNRPTPPLMIAP